MPLYPGAAGLLTRRRPGHLAVVRIRTIVTLVTLLLSTARPIVTRRRSRPAAGGVRILSALGQAELRTGKLTGQNSPLRPGGGTRLIRSRDVPMPPGRTFSTLIAWAVCHPGMTCLDPAGERLAERKSKDGPVWGFTARRLTAAQMRRAADALA